jgi:hypothetical protein
MGRLFSEFKIYFSYNQFMVYDLSISLPGCMWTESHANQGFARRSSTVNFGTILDFGDATVKIFIGDYVKDNFHERVISVPFYSPTGEILVEGPEEHPSNLGLKVSTEPGYYKLTSAQKIVNEVQEEIELFFKKLEKPTATSEVLLADDALNPPKELLEEAEIAE